jgi:RND family efflux transporter MFP subunit
MGDAHRARYVDGTGDAMSRTAAVWLAAASGLLFAMGVAADADEDTEDAPSDAPVTIETAAVSAAEVARTVVAFGNVIADPAATDVIALPRAGVIAALLVRTGERVAAGQALLEVETAAAPRLQYDQALAALHFAQTQLAAVQRLFDQQLATRDQLAQAQRDLADARSAEQSLKTIGANAASSTVRAPHAGIVAQLNVSAGDRPAADAPIMQLATAAGLMVRLGVEPATARQLQPGAVARLTALFDDGIEFDAPVRTVTAMLNPTTQLVDVVLAIPEQRISMLALGGPIRGVFEVEPVAAWLVPRSAVLRDDSGDYLFVADAGHAHRVDVAILRDRDAQLAVGGALTAQDRVVVEGNYQLSDGAAIAEADAQ